MLSWAEIRQRLTAIMAATPRGEQFLHDPSAKLVLRIRDIAHYTGIDHPVICHARAGTREMAPAIQRKLSWFFQNWDLGRLTKELQADGKARVVYRDPKSQAYADETRPREVTEARSMKIDITPEGPKLRVRHGRAR